MTLPRLINLLDDFALGGVSRGLGIFESQPLRQAAHCSVAPISPNATLAPKLEADIIVTHFPPNWRRLAFLASLRLRNPQARIIHVEHSYTRAWEALKVPPQAQHRFRLMLKLALRCVDQVVCVSSGQARWVQEVARFPDSRLKVIHPYAENPGLEGIPLPNLNQSRRLRIGAYGRFHEAKGFDWLIEAYQAGALPGTELIIGGFGAEEERLRKLAAENPRVVFTGKVRDVAAFLGSCDVIAVPSRWEAYGQVANEAREAGRPILVSPVDGLPEQVGDAGVIINFSSPEAVARTFAKLDSHRLQSMAHAGREATRNCGIQRQQAWADLVRRLMANPQPSSAAGLVHP